jgi:hypothetical protein
MMTVREITEGDTCGRQCEGAAYRFLAQQEKRRADVLAATISALKELVLIEHESKESFIDCVRKVLSDDPDKRLNEKS